MTEFSMSQALGAGFRLITHKPLAVVVWGFLHFLITVVPMLLLAALFMPSLISAAQDGGAINPAAIAGMNALQPITWITSIVANAIVFNAVYRAVLTPQDDRGFYIRFSKAEVWQGVVQLVLMVGLFVLFMVLAVVFALMFGAAFVGMMAAGQGSAGAWPAVGLGGFLLALVVLLAVWWLALRFSLAGPMTFAEKQFRLFESWTMTKGQTLRLFGLSLLLVLIIFLLYLATILLVGILVLILGLAAGGLAGPGGLERLFTGGAGIAVVIPVVLIGLVIGCAIYGVFLTVWVAPWAEVYRQLSGRTVDAETFA